MNIVRKLQYIQLQQKVSNLILKEAQLLKLRNWVDISILILFLMFLAWGCASTGYPTGGKKDVDPPVVLRSDPPANSLNFKGSEVVISFNEIIQVKDIFQKLVVSPPVNKRPVVTARGRELVIRFEEDLQPNTTYTLDFADAISDNNEGNVLQDFRFSFSTGMVVDSLSVSGFLFDATNLTPVAGALVMIHKNQADSAFKTQVPVRLAKTNQDGGFSVQNVAPGEYRLYALEDANRNYIYDQPGERIAWHSDLVVPAIEQRQRLDSIGPDSVSVINYRAFLPDSLQVFLFQEDNAPQYLKDNKRPSRNRIDFVFNRPNNTQVDFSLVREPSAKNWFIYEQSFEHDSITVWLTDSVHIKSDSLFMLVRYEVLDSLKRNVFKTDTLNAFFFQMGGGESRQRRRDQPKEIPTLKPVSLKRTLEILSEFDFVFPTPVNQYDLSKIQLNQVVDTVLVPVEFTLIRDPVRLRRFIIDYPWEPGGKYEFLADSAAFTDIYGMVSGTIKQSFSVKTIDSYGIIYVDIANPQPNWIIQVLNQQEKLVRQSKIPRNGKIGFQFLRPGDYFLRIFVDVNGNEIWDTGDFDKGQQPERLMYFPESVNIRANWDRIVPWNPAAFDIHDFVKRNRKKTGQQRR